MKSVYKYVLHPLDVDADSSLSIAMPRQARPLCVHVQRDLICLWAEVDTDQPEEIRQVWLRGTGTLWKRPDMAVYVGTALLFDASFVRHVYVATVGKEATA